MLDKRRVVITGSLGYIGQALSRALSAIGYDVWGIDQAGDPDHQVVEANLLDLQETREVIAAMPAFETLIHTAALAHGERPPAGESCLTINTKITDNVLEALEERIPHLIFLSSVAVYGEYGRDHPVSVDEDLRSPTEYGKSKALCEERIKASKLKHCDILRLSPVYDKNHMKDVRKRVFLPGLSAIKILLRPPPLCSLCHIDTVVQTVLNLLAQTPSEHRTANVADPEPYSQNEIASWFPGKGIPLPTALVRALCWLTFLLPRKQGYALRCLYWKLFRSNTYETGLQSRDSCEFGAFHPRKGECLPA